VLVLLGGLKTVFERRGREDFAEGAEKTKSKNEDKKKFETA
jgi:hypothetical protein